MKMNENELLTNICEFYPIKITRAFDNDKKAITALEIIGKELIELFNFFEPAHFKGKFFVIKNLDDNFILPEKDGQLITLNKDILLNFLLTLLKALIKNSIPLCLESLPTNKIFVF